MFPHCGQTCTGTGIDEAVLGAGGQARVAAQGRQRPAAFVVAVESGGRSAGVHPALSGPLSLHASASKQQGVRVAYRGKGHFWTRVRVGVCVSVRACAMYRSNLVHLHMTMYVQQSFHFRLSLYGITLVGVVNKHHSATLIVIRLTVTCRLHAPLPSRF